MKTNNIELTKTTAQDLAVYCDERIAFIEKLQDMSLPESVEMETFLIVLFLRGNGSICIDGQTWEIGPRQLLICRPHIVLERSRMSLDVDFRCICVSKDYMHQLLLTGGNNPWDARMFFEQHPVITLTEAEAHTFCQYYDLIREKLTAPLHRHQQALADALLQAFFLEFSDMITHTIDENRPSASAAARLFAGFLELLSTGRPKVRRVDYYADRLCITAKHLTAICRETSGHTASEIIHHYVGQDIRRLLARPELSIKEVASRLDFPNLSFFGRYVKKHFGLSPRRFRESLFREGTPCDAPAAQPPQGHSLSPGVPPTKP